MPPPEPEPRGSARPVDESTQLDLEAVRIAESVADANGLDVVWYDRVNTTLAEHLHALLASGAGAESARDGIGNAIDEFLDEHGIGMSPATRGNLIWRIFRALPEAAGAEGDAARVMAIDPAFGRDRNDLCVVKVGADGAVESIVPAPPAEPAGEVRTGLRAVGFIDDAFAAKDAEIAALRERVAEQTEIASTAARQRDNAAARSAKGGA